MMKRLLFCILLSGCTMGGSLLPKGESRTQSFHKDYQSLASCSFVAIEKSQQMQGLVKTELPTEKTSRLTMEPSGIRYWEINFVGTASNQTRVEMTPYNNMWGTPASASLVLEQVWNAVEKCST
jgi:hypothetical protein